MKHKWEDIGMDALRCFRCKEITNCTMDWCDTDGIVKWYRKTLERNDCKGSSK